MFNGLKNRWLLLQRILFINIITIDGISITFLSPKFMFSFSEKHNNSLKRLMYKKKKIFSVACMTFSYTQDLLLKATTNLVSAFFEISL